MLIVGLTGGIGSGKSAVSNRLASRGAVVIDADQITRELQEPGQPVLAAMVERFGAEILDAEGRLDRQRVADVVFTDGVAKSHLEAIVHPAVGATIAERMAAATETDIVVLDIPLLVEKGREDLAATIVVDVEPEAALGRLVDQRGFREDDALARMANQVSREERLARADFVVDNRGTLDDLDREIDRLWSWLTDLQSRGSSAGAEPPN